MIKAIIFDLDGTLCETLVDIRTAINAMLTRLGYRTRTRADLLRFINNGARELVRRSLPKDVHKVEFIVDSALGIYETEYAKCHCDKVKAFDGIMSALAELKGKGYKLAVLSNKQHQFVKNIIDKEFGKGVFNVVMGHSSYPTKPDPTSALAIAKQLGAKPERCVFVGDSDVDMQTAKNAGMLSVGCEWGYRDREVLEEAGATKIATSPEELVSTVEDLERTLEAAKIAVRLAKRKKAPRPE